MWDELKLRVVSLVGRLLVIVIGGTLRIKYVGTMPKQRVIYAFWHGLFFPLIYAHKRQGVLVLVSRHRDGEYLARILKPLGYQVIRGSSTGGGAKALLELSRLTKCSFAIAPDGPIGPRYHVKDGILKLAELTGLSIIPLGIAIFKPIRFGSWDKFNLPLPFSKCIVYIGTPIYVKKPSTSLKGKLESLLIEVNGLANSLVC